MTFLTRFAVTHYVLMLLAPVFVCSSFAQTVLVLPGNGSTSGNARAPQGSRLFANSKYLITGTEMTASAFGANAVSSIGWRWNVPRPAGAGAPAAQSVATTGNLKVFLKDTTADAAGLIGTFIDTNGVGYTKIIDATISITRTDTLEFSIDVPVGGPGTSRFTVTPGNGILVIFTYTTTTPIATPLGAPTVYCSNTGAILTYQSQTVNGTAGTASTFRPETRFGRGAPTQTTTRRPNLSIPDNLPAGTRDTLTVSGIPAGNVVRRLTVVIDTLTHTWVGDMIMTLTHGTTTRTLMNRPGTGAAGSSGDNFIGTALVDSATLRIDSIAAAGAPPIGPPYTGYFRPDSGGAPAIFPSSLAPFNGSNPNGQWILFVSDNAAADTGRVRQWKLIVEYGPSTAVEELPNLLPNGFTLDQNYPNPFNPTTTIRFSLPEAANVNLSVYNLLGQRVATLDNDVHNSGVYNVTWNGHNDAGAQVASGMYFYRMEATGVSGEKFNSLKKLILLK